jgi:sec-independent protein translocase protein TatA
MFGLGTPELLVIFGIAFLVFGGKKLPEIGAGLGKGIKSFKSGLREVEETGKNLVKENVPGVKEMNSLKEEVNKAKDIGNVLKG